MLAMTAKTALTGISAAQYSLLPMMRKWFTVLILIAALTGSALAGVHGNESAHKCPMMGMSDCCETATLQTGAPQVTAARLCCTLNCTEPGTTGPTGTFNLSSSLSLAVHSGVVPPPAAANPYTAQPHSYSSPSPARDSHPTYIRHLALLI
jgi:hypothetical protein